MIISEYFVHSIYFENMDLSLSVYGVGLYIINRNLLDSILNILLLEAGIRYSDWVPAVLLIYYHVLVIKHRVWIDNGIYSRLYILYSFFENHYDKY